ncbi:GSCOCG00001007001-RA-CDS [Cotesia congregata]|nr:GSCOCG00001007001-RA-CDS [Cotesia congregata]
MSHSDVITKITAAAVVNWISVNIRITAIFRVAAITGFNFGEVRNKNRDRHVKSTRNNIGDRDVNRIYNNRTMDAQSINLGDCFGEGIKRTIQSRVDERLNVRPGISNDLKEVSKVTPTTL